MLYTATSSRATDRSNSVCVGGGGGRKGGSVVFEGDRKDRVRLGHNLLCSQDQV